MVPTRLWMAFAPILAAALVHAAPAPEWVQHAPSADKAFVYAVGNGESTSLPEAEKAALADALAKLAAQAGVTVAARTIATESTRESDSNIFVETKSSARGIVRDAEPVGRPWVVVSRNGIWKRKSIFTVKILTRWPRASLERERQRQTSAWKDYRDTVDRLTQGVFGPIRKVGQSETVAVSGFHEAATGRPYAFTQILQRDVADSLVRAGVVVVPAQKARRVLITGVYRVVGNEVVVTARVVRIDTRESVGVAEVALDRGAIEPSWLENTTPIDSFFESLESERANTSVRVGAISVMSKPEGQIFVDGTPHGRTPSAFGGIAVGQRSVTVVSDGHEPFIKQVRVLEGETVSVEAALIPKSGDLEIRSHPTGAEVFNGDRLVGKTPLYLKGLPVGHYGVRLVLADYMDATFETEIKHKEKSLTEIRMTEQPGSIFVVTNPPGGEVFLDGISMGKAAAPKFLKLERVSAGHRQILVSKRGFGAWSGAVTVHANRTETINAELKSSIGILSLSISPPSASIKIDGTTLSAEAVSRQDSAGCGRDQAIEDFRASARGRSSTALSRCHLSLSLESGKHRVEIYAPGHETEERTISIKPGRRSKLGIHLLAGSEYIKNGRGDHLVGELIPGIKGFAEMDSRADDGNGLAASLLLVIAVGGDLIGLPYHMIRATYRHLPGRGQPSKRAAGRAVVENLSNEGPGRDKTPPIAAVATLGEVKAKSVREGNDRTDAERSLDEMSKRIDSAETNTDLIVAGQDLFHLVRDIEDQGRNPGPSKSELADSSRKRIAADRKYEDDCRANPTYDCTRTLTIQCDNWGRDLEDCKRLIRDRLFLWDALPNRGRVENWQTHAGAELSDVDNN